MTAAYSFILVDDSDVDRMILKQYLKEFDFLGEGHEFAFPKQALAFFERNKTDILFLDIEMPELNGIELLKQVREKVQCVVFITSYPNFALEGFELNASDYIIKPFSMERITGSLQRVRNILDNHRKASIYDIEFMDNSITLKSGNHLTQINPLDVVYLEAMKDYTKVMLPDKKSIIIHGNLATTLRRKAFVDYMRIGKSHAIRLNTIQSIKSGSVLLKSGISLPLGNAYRKELMNLLSMK